MTETYLSTGIDIGTSTTHLVISKLCVEIKGGFGCVPSASITSRKILYKSPIRFTPLLPDGGIDEDAVAQILKSEYKNAGISPESIKTGAVIITGESLKRRNAEKALISTALSAGDFIVSEVGGNTESILAAKGAGTDIMSASSYCVSANIDIGGGTSNTAVFNCGSPVAASCIDIGGRLIKVSKANGRISAAEISPCLLPLLKKHGITLSLNDEITNKTALKIGEIMAQEIFNELKRLPRADEYTFSGGVAECMGNEYDDDYKYGDFGIILARAIENSDFFSSHRCAVAPDPIRATVIGTGNYSVNLSGSTITYSHCVFPIKNIPCIYLKIENESDIDASFAALPVLCGAVKESEAAAVYLKGYDGISAAALRKISALTAKGMEEYTSGGNPLVIITQKDIGKALGICLIKTLPRNYPLVSIDCITVSPHDYIDIGAPVCGGASIPVAVKQLVFSEPKEEMKK